MNTDEGWGFLFVANNLAEGRDAFTPPEPMLSDKEWRRQGEEERLRLFREEEGLPPA